MRNSWTLSLALMLLAAATLSSAEPPRYRTSRRNGQLRTNIRFLQRQEEAPSDVEEPAVVESAPPPTPTDDAAAAPYAPAGVTPAVPFDLPTETESAVAPENSYGPPATGADDGATEPPLAGGNNSDAEQLPQSATAGESLVAQNLIQPRQHRPQQQRRSKRLRAAPLQLRAATSLNAPRTSDFEIVRSEPLLVYTLD